MCVVRCGAVEEVNHRDTEDTEKTKGESKINFILVPKLCLVTPVREALLRVGAGLEAELLDPAFPNRVWERVGVSDFGF
jgi:hypothetical protein